MIVGCEEVSDTYKPAIHFQQVEYSAGELTILKGITGSFPEGKVTTLVGPSGAGKSTLLKLCNGLRSPDSGEIFIKNKNINSYDPIALRRLVGMALQNAPMISGTVNDNLNLPLALQGGKLPESKAVELLEDVGLEGSYLSRNVKDLSGGQRQKLSIARTLVNQPQILLLDEITASLDRTSTQETEELIVKINEKYQTTMIWITHNLHQALNVGDFTWVMMAGELVEAGNSDLLKSPKNEKVKRFVKGEER